MSNLDTTLREKFLRLQMVELTYGDGSKYKVSALDPKVASQIADWWLAEFHQLMNEKREAIEGKRKPRITDEMISNIPFGAQVQEQYVGYNQALDDVLSILKD